MPLSDVKPGMDEKVSREKDVLLRNFQTVINHMKDVGRTINKQDPSYKTFMDNVEVFEKSLETLEKMFEAAGFD